MSRYHDNAEVSVGHGLLRYTDDYAVPDFDFFSTRGKPKRKRALDRQKRFQVSSFFFVSITIHQRQFCRPLPIAGLRKKLFHAFSGCGRPTPALLARKIALGPGFYRWVAVNITSRGKRGGMEGDVGPSLVEEVWEAMNWILDELRKEGPLDGMTRQARLLFFIPVYNSRLRELFSGAPPTLAPEEGG